MRVNSIKSRPRFSTLNKLSLTIVKFDTVEGNSFCCINFYRKHPFLLEVIACCVSSLMIIDLMRGFLSIDLRKVMEYDPRKQMQSEL